MDQCSLILIYLDNISGLYINGGFNGIGTIVSAISYIQNLSPGFPANRQPGSLIFKGDLFLNAQSSLNIDIYGEQPGLFDFITVTGTATVWGAFPVLVNYTSSYGDSITIMTFGVGNIAPNNLQIIGATSNQGITFNTFGKNLTLVITNKAAIQAGIVTSILVPIAITLGVLLGICCAIIIIVIIIICCITGGVGTGYAVRRKLTADNFF